MLKRTVIVPLAPRGGAVDRPIGFYESQILLFEKEHLSGVVIGQPVEVMFSGVLYRKEKGSDMYNKHDVAAVFVRPVTRDYVLIDHDGFECSGSMCATTAVGTYRGKRKLLTPGRTHVYEADNTNTGWHGRQRIDTRPSKAYVRLYDWEHKTPVRIEGLYRIQDGVYFPYIGRKK